MTKVIYLFLIISGLHLVTAQVRFEKSNNNFKNIYSADYPAVSKDTVINVIVEFREEPLASLGINSITNASVGLYIERFSTFRYDLNKIQSETNTFSASSTIEHKYYKTFFGVSVSVPSSLLPLIEQISYVKKIHPDHQAHVDLYKSIPQIQADQVWADYGVKGEGITIGIIDTGIDYLHPALGNGFGKDYKIIGGYDFVNNDNDPFDDNGHGTHVAGIAAADGAGVQGVAPKARLFAFKVLNSEGRGNESLIIAAIERTVDPDNDGNFVDKLDIVNMSLGFDNGDPDDAASTAVDNAVKAGVTFCISAGNNGAATPVQGKENNYYYSGMETISSPGVARLAITVGAVDSVNKPAYFSSKGPVGKTFAIKPDVVAPGYGIRSLLPGASFGYKSGTSMASPMVAGVAALLKSYNKNFSPAQIKSAIVNYSIPLGLNTMVQGAGLVNSLRCLKASTYSQPVSISFGVDNPAQQLWSKSDTLVISNTGKSSQNYSVAFTANSPAISLSAFPQNFSLSTGQTRSLIISVSADNNSIPLIDEDIIIYNGNIKVNGTADSIIVPWAFVRTTKMTLSFNEPNAKFIGAGDKYYITPYYSKDFSKIRWTDSKTVEVIGAFIEPYDFAVYFPQSNRLVLKEGLNFSGANSFNFNSSEAQHKITYNGTDDNGVSFSEIGRTARSLQITLPMQSRFLVSLPLNNPVLFSTAASPKFSFLPSEICGDPDKLKRLYLPQYTPFSGINGDMTISRQGSKYCRQTLRFKTPADVFRLKMFSEIINYELYDGTEHFNSVMAIEDTISVNNGIAQFDLYFMPPTGSPFGNSIAFHVNHSNLNDNYLDYSTRYFSIINDSILANFASQNSLSSYKSPSGGSLTFGDGPVNVFNLFYNNSFGSSIQFRPMFFGPLLEERYKDINSGRYKIFNSGEVLIKEDLLYVSRTPLNVEPGKYKLEIKTDSYSLKNVVGKLTLTNKFDLTKPIPDPPVFTSINLVNKKNLATNNFTLNEKASVLFSAKTISSSQLLPVDDSTVVFFRKYKSKQWVSLPVSVVGKQIEKTGTVFRGDLTLATSSDSSAIDLLIRTADSFGNSSELILSPAFSVGNWIEKDPTDSNDNNPILLSFALDQNYPNPFNSTTTISYTIPQTGPVSVMVYDILGREVASLLNEVQQAGTHTILFHSSALSSGVYIYRIKAGNNVYQKKMALLK